MSWIFGVIKKNKSYNGNLLSKVIDNPIIEYCNDNLEMYSGGFLENLHTSKINKSTKEGWITSGIGIQKNDFRDGTRILNNNDWTNVLQSSNEKNKIVKLDGHFAILKWNKNKVTFYTDLLGLRDIYLAENDNGIFFSTNVMWFSKLFDLEINFSEFSSRWLLFNQISSKSIFNNVERIVAGKSVTINLNSFERTYYKNIFMPTFQNSTYNFSDFHSEMSKLTNINLPNGHKLSLSLSGGMDSRVILSYLLNSNSKDWNTHTFGSSDHVDSQISKSIVNNLKIEHEQFNAPIPSVDYCIKEIGKYSSETLVNNAASGFIQLQNYSFLKNRSITLIDGGFGEIWRREFFYKLYLKGNLSLQNKDMKNIIPYLSLFRADIFNYETNKLMKNGNENQLSELFEEMPTIKKNNLENWLDLFAIKTRLPNYYSHEQTRLDNYLTGVMPFIQQSLVNNLFNLPIDLRKNGKLFRKAIKHNYSSLSKFQLAKSRTTHPYYLNSLQSRLWSLAHSKLNLTSNVGDSSLALLNILKEFVYDLINSRQVKNVDYYDNKKIKNIVDSYYNGDLTYSNELDWWISFELFRQNHSKP